MLTDFHSHILPGVDDGSQSPEESIAMLKLAAEQGIRRMVATPHFVARGDTPQRFLERRDRAEARLRRELDGYADLPQLLVGAEVRYFRGISEWEFLPQLTIGDSHCVLIEMTAPPWPETAYAELEAIWTKRGLIPVLAHIDRYIAPFRTSGIPERLEELPVYVQANAEFFLERSTQRMALRMLRQDRIHLLGSDCHNTDSRKPNLGEAIARIQKKLGEDPLHRICHYENRILSKQTEQE